jgi:hypothetical membrane protein
MLFVVIISFASIRSTSSTLEKVVLVLSGILCSLVLVGVLPELGYPWAVSPFANTLFVVVSCAVALLAGLRTIQIATSRSSMDTEPQDS